MSTYESNTSQSLNRETMTLLKQQMIKLKLLSNDLQLKTQQYQMLKQTLQSLDQQKLAILEDNEKLRTDIVAIILHNQQCQKQLTQRGERVAQLQEEKVNVNIQIQKLKQEIVKLNSTIVQSEEQKKHIVKKYERVNKELQQATMNQQSKQSMLENLKNDNEIANETNKKLSFHINSLNIQLSSLSKDLNNSKDQYHNLKYKFESLTHEFDQRKKELVLSKQTIKQFSQRQQNLLMIQQQYFSSQKTLQNIQKQLKRIQKQHVLVQQQNIALKKQAQKHKDIDYDIGILERVFDISQFNRYLSKYGSRFQKISNFIIKLIKQNQQILQDNNKLSQQLQEHKLLLKQQINKILSLQRELQVSESQFKLELESLISKHQTILASQQVLLKQSQAELTQTLNKSSRLNHILIKYESQCQQIDQKNKILSQNKQFILNLEQMNSKLKTTIQEMIEQCQESIQWKKKVNSLKHIYYAAKHIKQINIFKQYFQSLILAHFQNKKIKKIQRTNRMRSVVQGIIFTIRLKSSMKKYKYFQPINVSNKIVQKLINVSSRLDQNHITASFLNQFSVILNTPSLSQIILTQKLLTLFQKKYVMNSNEFLKLKI